MDFPELIEGESLAMWLGGRDSNPDNVVQRAADGLRFVSFRSGLIDFSALSLQ
jgi:hypothetical protein